MLNLVKNGMVFFCHHLSKLRSKIVGVLICYNCMYLGRKKLFKMGKCLFVIKLCIIIFGVPKVLADVYIFPVYQAKYTF